MDSSLLCPWVFSKQEYWRGWPCPPPGDLPILRIEARTPALWADSLPAESLGKPKKTGMGSLSLLQGIFPTQELNWGLLHCRQIPYQLSYQGRCWFYKDYIKCYWFLSCYYPISQSCPALCNRMSGFLVLYYQPEFSLTHGHWVDDATQPSHPLSPPSPPALNFSQHQGLLQWVSFLHQVVKVLELQLQHQSFQGIFRTDFL